MSIRREYTTPYNLKQNGIIERMNQTIHEWISPHWNFQTITTLDHPKSAKFWFRGFHTCAKGWSSKVRATIREMKFPWLWIIRQFWLLTLGSREQTRCLNFRRYLQGVGNAQASWKANWSQKKSHFFGNVGSSRRPNLKQESGNKASYLHGPKYRYIQYSRTSYLREKLT